MKAPESGELWLTAREIVMNSPLPVFYHSAHAAERKTQAWLTTKTSKGDKNLSGLSEAELSETRNSRRE